MARTKVLLVEDHDVVREGLRALIQSEADIEVVGEASDGCAAVKATRELSPDVVVMDVRLPEQNGFEATLQIKRACREARVLVLSSYDDLECVERMVEAGAMGFLTKRSASNQLAEAIRMVRSGRMFYSPEISKGFKDCRNAALKAGRPAGRRAELTVRETQALELIARGLRNKTIAGEMGVSIKTVEKHRQSVMNKLNIHDAAGLTRYALRTGLVSATIPKSGTAPEAPVGI